MTRPETQPVHGAFRAALAAVLACVLVAMVLGSVACDSNHRVNTDSGAGLRLQPAPPNTVAPTDYPGLHNAVAFGPGLYSGSAPEGEAGFASLRALGVRTIISVDGARPETDRAEALGMRYVHLPIAYNGMDEARKLAIARAVRDLPGPVYLHCHHGKHRSAGAAGAAAVTLGNLTNEEALRLMRVAGTSPAYPGLFACVTAAKPDADGVSKADAAFPNVWKTTGLVGAMVEMDEAFDRIRDMQKNGWKPPGNHPDLAPAAEAGKLADHFRMLLDDPQVKSRPAKFRELLAEGDRLASSLESGLAAGAPAESLAAQVRAISNNCNDCHAQFRN